MCYCRCLCVFTVRYVYLYARVVFVFSWVILYSTMFSTYRVISSISSHLIRVCTTGQSLRIVRKLSLVNGPFISPFCSLFNNSYFADYSHLLLQIPTTYYLLLDQFYLDDIINVKSKVGKSLGLFLGLSRKIS